MSFVLDASIAMAWLFADKGTSQTETLLDRLGAEEAAVPALWPYEIANVLVVAERRQRIAEAQGRHFTRLLSDLPIRVVEAGSATQWDGAMSAATRYGLTVYDAAYLDLAMREGLSLATQDKALRAAAEQSGVTLI
jgi:predicted nucleic acid-binding protein